MTKKEEAIIEYITKCSSFSIYTCSNAFMPMKLTGGTCWKKNKNKINYLMSYAWLNYIHIIFF